MKEVTALLVVATVLAACNTPLAPPPITPPPLESASAAPATTTPPASTAAASPAASATVSPTATPRSPAAATSPVSATAPPTSPPPAATSAPYAAQVQLVSAGGNINGSQTGAISVRAGVSGQLTVGVLNVGTTTWVKGTSTQIALATCCPLGARTTLASWTVGATATRYAAQTTASVPPGSIAFVLFSFTVPAGTAPGDYRSDARVVLDATGAQIASDAIWFIVHVS